MELKFSVTKIWFKLPPRKFYTWIYLQGMGTIIVGNHIDYIISGTSQVYCSIYQEDCASRQDMDIIIVGDHIDYVISGTSQVYYSYLSGRLRLKLKLPNIRSERKTTELSEIKKEKNYYKKNLNLMREVCIRTMTSR